MARLPTTTPSASSAAARPAREWRCRSRRERDGAHRARPGHQGGEPVRQPLPGPGRAGERDQVEPAVGLSAARRMRSSVEVGATSWMRRSSGRSLRPGRSATIMLVAPAGARVGGEALLAVRLEQRGVGHRDERRPDAGAYLCARHSRQASVRIPAAAPARRRAGSPARRRAGRRRGSRARSGRRRPRRPPRPARASPARHQVDDEPCSCDRLDRAGRGSSTWPRRSARAPDPRREPAASSRSLSPRPTGRRGSALRRGRAPRASAWADSSAGMMPSVRPGAGRRASASSSVAGEVLGPAAVAQVRRARGRRPGSRARPRSSARRRSARPRRRARGAGAVQDARPARAERGRARRLDADQPHLGRRGSRRTSRSRSSRRRRRRSTASGSRPSALQDLRPRLAPDHRLQLAHDLGVGARARRRSRSGSGSSRRS